MTNINGLTEHLFKLWEKDRFPDSLIVRLLTTHSYLSEKVMVETFLNAFFKRLLNRQNIETMNPGASSPHPDILLLCPKKEYFSVEELDILYSFLNSKSLSLNKKIIIFPKAIALGHQEVANKLLKTLESPPIPATFILILKGSKKLLPTIEGRSLKFNLFFDQSKNASYSNFYQFFAKFLEENNQLSGSEAHELTLGLKSWANNEKDFNSFFSAFSKIDEKDESIKKMTIDYIRTISLSSSSSPHDIKLKKNILNILKDFEKAELFNNPRISRHACLFHFLLGHI